MMGGAGRGRAGRGGWWEGRILVKIVLPHSL